MDSYEDFFKEENDLKEIQDYLKSNFDNFKSLVCNEFINYYGEQYRDEITYRLNNTNFIFYINEFKPLLGSIFDYFNKDNLKDRYVIIKDKYKQITNYYKRVEKEIDINSDLKAYKMINKIIFDTSNTVYNDKDKKQREFEIDDAIKEHEICYFPMYLEDSKTIEHAVVIPIFKANDCNLIHEMIHGIMSQDLLLKENNTLYSKTGLAIGMNSETLLEECLTEIDAQSISKILKEKGIEFIEKFYPKKCHRCNYNTYIPFFREFYEYFKDDLIYSRITLNKSHLLEQIDRENYYYFMVSIADCHRNYFDRNEFNYYKIIFDEHINKMKDNYKVLKLK